ncbi:MAG: T9SS type A sorting domain-containing protein [bacterium]|nr:MAG: T9SS type A sorting domain-containing protein [bacterium]
MSIGATLRIEPGVVLKFRSTRPYIIIEGGLKADATADSMIAFTSQYDDDVGNPADTEGNGTATTPATADWSRIKFASTSFDSVCILDYCIVSYGGYHSTDNYRGAIWCNSASPTITNCQFSTNRTGIRTDGNSAPLIEDNDFFNHTYIPLATSVVSDPEYIGNTFNQNNYHAVGILSETLAENATLERIEVGGPPQFAEYFPYLHLGELTISSGAILTIEPGIVVKNTSGWAIDVDGGLRMIGKSDPDSLIVYTSILDDSYGGDSNVDGSATSPAAGDWGGIRFNSTTMDADAIIDYCLFRFGGSSSYKIIECQSASPTIRNSEFEINTWGLWIQNASDPVIEDNMFRLITFLPISKSVLAEPTFSGNTYDNNGFTALGLIGEDIAQDLTVRKWDIAGYTNITRILVYATLEVNLGSKLIIEPGVVIKMGARYPYNWFAKNIYIDGAIEAVGTEVEPIVFTSFLDDEYGNPLDTNNDGALTEPRYGDWTMIQFNDVSTDSLNSFRHCILRYGGASNNGAMNIITSSPAISQCTFDDNYYYGIMMTGTSFPSIDTCTFSNHQRTPVAMSLLSDPSFSGNQFLASNAYSAIGILGETLAQDVMWKRRNVAQTENIPYVLLTNLTAGLSSILRIEPGIVIKPLSSVRITVKRGLIAEGKADPESLIVFTSANDDYYGGDTNNDSTYTDGTDQRWDFIQVDNEAIDDSTRFDYCVFRYATSNSSYGALNITNANPQIRHSIFSQNAVGINYNGAAGDSTKGKVEECDIYGNINYGIKNTGMSFTVWAQNCWWGHSTGPYDPSDDTGSGGFYNPGGLGDPVTDMVDYSNWQTDGVQNYLLGDVSLNGYIRAYDASLVLQHVALLITLSPLQQEVGDVTCNGNLSALDASYILRYVAGLISHFPCAFDSIVTCPAPLAMNDYFPGLEQYDFQVRIPAFTLDPGGTVTLPIEISGSGELLGHEYGIVFDPDQISIEDVRLTEAAAGADLVWHVVNEKELRIALASVELMPVEAAVEITVRANGTLDKEEEIPFSFTHVLLNEQDLTGTAASEGGNRSGREMPSSFRLDQNYPNPFNPSTRIRYAIPPDVGKSVHVSLKIFDVAGRLVRTLVSRDETPGIKEVAWDGLDNNGNPAGSGMYFYRIEAGAFKRIHKMVLLR